MPEPHGDTEKVDEIDTVEDVVPQFDSDCVPHDEAESDGHTVDVLDVVMEADFVVLVVVLPHNVTLSNGEIEAL